MSNGTNPPKKRGCLFYGCLSMVGVGLVMVLVFTLTIYFLFKKARNTLDQYTEKTPTVFEVPSYSPTDYAALKGRVSTFHDALTQHRVGSELVLTADDLNVLINEQSRSNGNVFVSIESDRVKGKFTVPFDNLIPASIFRWFPSFRGRHLNGSATFRVAYEGGQLDVRAEQMEAKGRSLDGLPLIGSAIADLKKKNLASEAKLDAQLDGILRNIDNLQIKDGKIILRSK